MRALPAWVEIDLDALANNIQGVQSLIGPTKKILLIVKADAYGHGAVEVAQEAVQCGVHMLGVATIDEGRELRAAGIETAILVLSPALIEEVPALIENNLRTTVSHLDFAHELSGQAQRAGKRVPIHIEVDTGMGRSGLEVDQAFSWIQQLGSLPGIVLEGLFTHFPVSDTDVLSTLKQVREFKGLAERLKAAGVHFELIHAANSAAILRVPEAHLDMVRPGGLIYGVMPHANLETGHDFQPVMSFHARLVQVRSLPARHGISYGCDVMTCGDLMMGVVPVGYGHGLPRDYSGVGKMLFRGRKVSILGRVTMDMTLIDLGDANAPQVGEEIVIFGKQRLEELPVSELGGAMGILGYEVVCGISKRVVRVYRRRGVVRSMRGLTGTQRVELMES